MADRTEELREDIQRQRQSIGYTVDQIQNRVSPGRITARGRYRVRRWLIDTKDQVMGNDQSDYPWERWSRDLNQKVGDMSDRAADAVTGAKDMLSEKAGDLPDRAADAVAGARGYPDRGPRKTSTEDERESSGCWPHRIRRGNAGRSLVARVQG